MLTDRRLPPRPDRLRVILLGNLVLSSGCFGWIVEQPRDLAERAAVFAEWAAVQLLGLLLLATVVWLVRAAFRRRAAFREILLYRALLLAFLAFNLQAIVRWALTHPERFNILL